MEKSELRTLFESEYPGKKAIFENLIQPIFTKAKDTTLSKEMDITEGDKKQIKSFSVIAQVRGGFPITFADVEVQDTVALKRNRVNIQNCVRKMMANDSNAIIFFHFTDNKSEWRVSYCHRATTNKESTDAKRFTYLCGTEHACRTIADRFDTLQGLTTIKDDDMLEAFGVEPLSKEFFDQYRDHYADLVEYISGKRFIKKGGKFVEEKTKNANGAFKDAFGGDDKLVRDYVKKMMGRLVFLHFLQKKGWLGVPVNTEWGSGDKNFIYNLFKNANDNIKSDFLEQALEPLFFKTLNTDRGKESIAPKAICDIYGSKIRIPYLNGGLFEEDELDKKKVKFKKEHFEALLEFFNQYNFTIDETDPDDQEIGVDPEMLGKIFENLLEDNKDKGAFYTPKEIVQYMCRESLIAYLEEKTKIDARAFVINHEVNFTDAQKVDVYKALLDVKICDPAVGSGAFPMGMLNELLACNQLLIGEAKTRSWLKKHIVKNNIYGVDIEKGAVDIARLRFWLAIIVDEDKPQPLPNLDYKIMQGNSLLECFDNNDLSTIAKEEVLSGKGKNLLDEYEDPDDAWKEIKNAQLLGFKQDLTEYYDTSDHIKKIKLQKEIMDFVKDRIVDKIDFETKNIRKRSIELDSKESAIHSSLKSFSSNSRDPAAIKLRKDLDKIIIEKKKISEILLDNQEKQKKVLELAFNNTELFLWHTWFGDVFNRPNNCNGFDIVIGNPPYGVSIKDDYRNKVINALGKVPDFEIYYYFIELSKKLISNDGILSYIIPNTWLFNTFAKNYRISTTKYWNIKEILDCSKFKIFESATVYNTIILLQKSKSENEKVIYRPTENSTNFIELISQKRQFLPKEDLLKMNQNWGLAFKISPEIISVIQKIKSNSSELQSLFPEISQGLIAYDKYKGQSDEIIKSRAYHSFSFKKGYKKNLWGEDVTRYSLKWNEQEYINYCDGIANPRKPKYFNGARILVREITNPRIFACYTDEEYYNDPSLLIVLASKNYDIKVLLGILNSKLATFYHFNNSPKATKGGFPKILIEDLKLFPLPKINETQKKTMINLVDKCLTEKRNNALADITKIDMEIDELVYDLYHLTDNEKKLIREKSK